jgi:hypothetical protein
MAANLGSRPLARNQRLTLRGFRVGTLRTTLFQCADTDLIFSASNRAGAMERWKVTSIG